MSENNTNRMIGKTDYSRKNIEVRSLIDQINKQEITVGSYLQSFLVNAANERKENFDPLPFMRAQRGFTWTKDLSSRFIFSVMILEDPIKTIYLYDTTSNGKFVKTLDGQQRLTTLWMFINNKFALDMSHADYNMFPIFGEMHNINELEGKTFSELPQEWQDRLLNYAQDVVIYKNCSDEQAKGIYKRMSTISKPLKPIEIRKADMSNDIADTIYFHIINQSWAFHVMTVKACRTNFGLDISTQFLSLLYRNKPIALTRDNIDKAIHDMSVLGLSDDLKKDIDNTVTYLNKATDMITAYKKKSDEEAVNKKGKRVSNYNNYKIPASKNKTYIVMLLWSAHIAISNQIDVAKFSEWIMNFFEKPSELFKSGMAKSKGEKPGDLQNVEKRMRAIDNEIEKLKV